VETGKEEDGEVMYKNFEDENDEAQFQIQQIFDAENILGDLSHAHLGIDSMIPSMASNKSAKSVDKRNSFGMYGHGDSNLISASNISTTYDIDQEDLQRGMKIMESR
jgi:hypothetical protein